MTIINGGTVTGDVYGSEGINGASVSNNTAVVANGTVYVSSSTKGPTDVARGEFALTLTGEANIASAIADGDPVAYVHPAEGTGLRTEGCAILENCKNLEAAELFMDFMTSKEGLDIIASYATQLEELANK